MVEDLYQDPDSAGYDMLVELEFETATPIMSHSRRRGGDLQIFESGGSYYIWNPIEGRVGRFLNTSFQEILEKMTKDQGATRTLDFEEEA